MLRPWSQPSSPPMCLPFVVVGGIALVIAVWLVLTRVFSSSRAGRHACALPRRRRCRPAAGAAGQVHATTIRAPGAAADAARGSGPCATSSRTSVCALGRRDRRRHRRRIGSRVAIAAAASRRHPCGRAARRPRRRLLDRSRAAGAPQSPAQDRCARRGHHPLRRRDRLDLHGNYGLRAAPLQVEPPDGGAPYEVTTKTYINRFEMPAYQPGVRLPARRSVSKAPTRVAVA